MNPKLIPVMVFILIAVMAVPLMMRLGMGGGTRPVRTLAELDAGPGRIVRITVEPNSQQTLSLHYHVFVEDRPVVEHAFFGTLPRTSPPPTFLVYPDGGGDLIGIAQTSVLDRIIIVHDFATGDSWPMREVTYKDTDPQHLYPYYEEAGSIEQRGDELFARLQEALPDQELELLRTMGTRPLTIPNAPVEAQP